MSRPITGSGNYLGRVEDVGDKKVYYDADGNMVGYVNEFGVSFDQHFKFKGTAPDEFGVSRGENFDYAGRVDSFGRFFDENGVYAGNGADAANLARLQRKSEPDVSCNAAPEPYVRKSVGYRKVTFNGPVEAQPSARGGLFSRIKDALLGKAPAADQYASDTLAQRYIRNYLSRNGIAYGAEACEQLGIEYTSENEFVFTLKMEEGYQIGGNVEYNENGLVVKTGCDRCAILKNGFEADKLIMNFNSLLKDGKFAFDTTKEPSHILFFIGINYGDLICFASDDDECLVEDAHRFSLSQQTVNDLFDTAIGEMSTLADAIAGG